MSKDQIPSTDRPGTADEAHTDSLLFLLNCYDVWSATPLQADGGCVDCLAESASL